MVVDLGCVRQNWHAVRNAAGGGRVGAVVKHDAYGHGLEEVTRTLALAGCDLFWTASPEEALQVRRIAPQAEIFVLEGFCGAAPDLFSSARLVPVLACWEEVVRAAGAGLPVAVTVDGGLCRLGLTDGELARLAADKALRDRLDIRLFVTQLANFSDPRGSGAAAQIARVRAALAPFGPAIALSLCSSAGVFCPPPGGAGVLPRVGSALYGVQTGLPVVHPVVPAVVVDAPLLRCIDVPAGTPVGYEGASVTTRQSRIATVAIGYGHGLPRALGCGGGHVTIGGRPAPFIGRLSMGLAAVDVTGIDDPDLLAPGARAEIIGPHQSPETLAAAGGTIANAFIMALAHALPRQWVNG